MRGGVLRGFALDPGHADGEGVEEAFLQVRRCAAQLRVRGAADHRKLGEARVDAGVPTAEPAPGVLHIPGDADHLGQARCRGAGPIQCPDNPAFAVTASLPRLYPKEFREEPVVQVFATCSAPLNRCTRSALG